MSVADRFHKHRVFARAGARLIRERGGRGAGLASDVWHVLWAAEDAATGTVQVGRRQIAAAIGSDPGSVHRALAALKELGFLKVLTAGTKDAEAAIYQLFAYPPGEQLPTDVLPRASVLRVLRSKTLMRSVDRVHPRGMNPVHRPSRITQVR